MKRGFFNPKLYGESLRQLRTTGILLGVLSVLSSVITVVIQYFSIRDSIAYGYSPSAPSAVEAAPALLVLMFLGGIVFIMKVFSFLHKRAASDYYHSLPDTRISQAVSLTLAALTWLYAIIITTVMLTWAAYGITGMPFNTALIPYLLLANMAGVTLVAGAALIGVSVTGTAFSAFIVTGLVLFLPRFIQFFFTEALILVAPIASAADFGLILNPSYNLPYGLILGILSGSLGSGFGAKSVSEILVFKGGIIYTAVLGIVYLALGGLLYTRRSSETADRSAPNRVLQHVFRCTLTLPILLVAVLLILDGVSLILPALVTILVSLVVYFCYELFTTRKARSLINAAPVFLIPAVLAAALGLGAWAMGQRILADIPDAGDIAFVNIDIAEQRYGYNDPGYSQLLTSRIEYDDPEIIAILAEGLEKTADHIKSDYRSGYSGVSQIFRLHLKNGKTITRWITLPPENNQRIQDLKSQNPRYQECSQALPSDEEVLAVSMSRMNQEDTLLVWESYRQEAGAMSHEDYEDMIISAGDGNFTVESTQWNWYANLTVTGSVGTENFRSSYALTDQTPQTSSLYLELINHSLREGFREQFGYIAALDPATDEDGYYSLTLELMSVPQARDLCLDTQYYSSQEPPDKELNQKLLDILTAALDYDGKSGQPIAKVTLHTPISGNRTQTMYLALTDEQTVALLALMDEYGYDVYEYYEDGTPVSNPTPTPPPAATPVPSPAAS